ncbi:MAG: DUF6989 domain-containing protein [Nevskiaceae bacterium]
MARATFWIFLTTGLLCGALVALPRFLGPPQLGQAIVAIVVLYNLVLLMGAWLRSHHELLSALAFLLPLSVCQVVPDALLAQHLGTLAFPDLGAPRFGPVPVYMAGLWVAPQLLVLWAAEFAHRANAVLAGLVAMVFSLAAFGAAEWAAAHVLALWHPRNVETWNGIALYVLPAEALLGLVAWLAFMQVHRRTIFMKAIGAAGVSLLYAGALFASHLAFLRWR